MNLLKWICLTFLLIFVLVESRVVLRDVPVAENNTVMEVRSVLIRCPNSPVIANPDKKYVSASRAFDIIKFYDMDRDEPLHYNRITNCKRKVVITIQFYNSGQMVEKEEVILVRRIYDPVVHQFCGLLKPMIIKLKQQQMRQAYHLNYIREVNGKPYEEVLNKARSNYTGCVYTTKNPTCGLAYKGGTYIPYSEGFCCSCDVQENIKRQPESFKSRSRTPEPYGRSIGMYPDFNHPLRNKGVEPIAIPKVSKIKEDCMAPKVTKGTTISPCLDVSRRKKQISHYEDVRTFQEDGCPSLIKGEWELEKHVRVKRQYTLNGRQVRGGQSCLDHYVPTNADPITYHDSAHCLRYSDLWYKLYALSPPFVERRINIQLYEKFFKQSGYSFWKRRLLSRGISVGSLRMEAYNPTKTVSFKYVPLSNINGTFVSLNATDGYILVPRDYSKMFPQVTGDPKEFMLVSPDQITEDGITCDKIGVNYNAFFHQGDRCGKQKGSCLANQPFDLWQIDQEAKSNGERGSYFLENFSKEPIVYGKENDKINDTYFTTEYYGPYKDALEMEVNADGNYALRLGSSAQISEVYVDCTEEETTNVSILIINRGLVSSRYRTKFTNCPEGVPIPWSSTVGPLVNIAPQKAHVFRVSLLGPRPINRFYCTVEVQNSIGETVARRRMKFQHLDRCVCMWHCLCSCLELSDGLRCSPMSIEHYHAAGFLGDLPCSINLKKESDTDSKYKGVLRVFYAVLTQLFLLGVLKGLLGLCFQNVASLWLWASLPYSSIYLRKYYDPCYRNTKVLRSRYGFALHPRTQKRNLQLTSRGYEFMVNCVFFLMLPGVTLLYYIGHFLAIIEEKWQPKTNDHVESTINVSNTSMESATSTMKSTSNSGLPTIRASSSQTDTPLKSEKKLSSDNDTG